MLAQEPEEEPACCVHQVARAEELHGGAGNRGGGAGRGWGQPAASTALGRRRRRQAAQAEALYGGADVQRTSGGAHVWGSS